MPNLKEHISRTRKRYGVDGKDIHEWIDEPKIIINSIKHRKYRHNIDMQIPKFILDKYGEELARNIIIDHILYDTITPTTNLRKYKSCNGIPFKEKVCHAIYMRIRRSLNPYQLAYELGILDTKKIERHLNILEEKIIEVEGILYA